MLPAKQILQRLLALLKLEHPINNGVNLIFLHKVNQLLKPVPRPIHHPLERNIPRQRQHIDVRPVPRLILLPREVPDARDYSTVGHAGEGLAEGLGAAALEDDVGAAVVGELHDGLVPVGRLDVVYNVVRAEGLGLFELVVRGRGHDGCNSVSGLMLATRWISK